MKPFSKGLLLIFTVSIIMQGTKCSSSGKPGGSWRRMEQKLEDFTGAFQQWQEDYQSWLAKRELSLQQSDRTDISDDTKCENLNKQIMDVMTMSHRLTEAFKAEKKYRLSQQKEISMLEEEMKQVKVQLINNKKQLEEVSEVKKDNENLQAEISDLKTLLHQVQQSVSSKHDTLERAMASDLKMLQESIYTERKRLASLQGLVNQYNLQTQAQVSFSAYLGTAIDSMNSWETLVFNVVITNYGQAYSPTTGEFTAPVDGMYVFFTHIMGAPRTMEMCVKKNQQIVLWLYSSGLGYGRDANMVVLSLVKGDKVKVVKHGPWGQRPFYIHNTWTTFSGFLLYTL